MNIDNIVAGDKFLHASATRTAKLNCSRSSLRTDKFKSCAMTEERKLTMQGRQSTGGWGPGPSNNLGWVNHQPIAIFNAVVLEIAV